MRQRLLTLMLYCPVLVRRRPTLRSVNQIHNFHCLRVFEHPIDHNERQRWQGQFARTLHAARSAAIRKGLKLHEAFVNRAANALSHNRIVSANEVDDVFEVGRRVG